MLKAIQKTEDQHKEKKSGFRKDRHRISEVLGFKKLLLTPLDKIYLNYVAFMCLEKLYNEADSLA